MKRMLALSSVAGLVVPTMAWAQLPPGWQVCWGSGCSVAVPIAPWIVVATGALLLLAGLTALRRHTRGGLFLLAGAVAVSAYGLHDIKSADAFFAGLSITLPSGNQTLTCSGPSLTVLNSSGAPVNLFLTPLNGANLGWLSGIMGACQQGGTLNNSASCSLPCTASPT